MTRCMARCLRSVKKVDFCENDSWSIASFATDELKVAPLMGTLPDPQGVCRGGGPKGRAPRAGVTATKSCHIRQLGVKGRRAHTDISMGVRWSGGRGRTFMLENSFATFPEV